MKTNKYKLIYFVRPENANSTLILDDKIEKFLIKKLESNCQKAIDSKDRF